MDEGGAVCAVSGACDPPDLMQYGPQEADASTNYVYNRSKKDSEGCLDPEGYRRLQRYVYQKRRDPFRKSPNKKAKWTEKIENRRVEEEGRERSLVYKKGQVVNGKPRPGGAEGGGQS